MFCYTRPASDKSIYDTSFLQSSTSSAPTSPHSIHRKSMEFVAPLPPPLVANNNHQFTSQVKNNQMNTLQRGHSFSSLITSSASSSAHNNNSNHHPQQINLVIDVYASYTPPNSTALKDCFDADYDPSNPTNNNINNNNSNGTNQQQQLSSRRGLYENTSPRGRANKPVNNEFTLPLTQQQQQQKQQQQHTNTSTNTNNNYNNDQQQNKKSKEDQPVKTTNPVANNNNNDTTSTTTAPPPPTNTTTTTNDTTTTNTSNKPTMTIRFIKRETIPNNNSNNNNNNNNNTNDLYKQRRNGISELSQRTGKKPRTTSISIASAHAAQLALMNGSKLIERTIRIYLQHSHRTVELNITGQTKAIDVIKKVISSSGSTTSSSNTSGSVSNNNGHLNDQKQQQLQQQQQQYAQQMHQFYMLYVSCASRKIPTVDTTYPPIESATLLLNLGVSDFIIVPKRSSMAAKAISSSSSTTVQLLQNRSRGTTMEDVMLHVYRGNATSYVMLDKPLLVPVAPDLLLRDLTKVLANRFDVDEKKFAIYMMIEGKQRAIPKHYRDRTLRSLPDVNSVAFIRIEDEPATSPTYPGRSPTPQLSAEEEGNELVLPFELDAFTYQEFRVIKTNKFGSRQERRLGIDSQKIFNMKPTSITHFLGLTSQKTKHPERPLETLANVTANPENTKAFTLSFTDGEVLSYETKTTVEAIEIVKRLKFLMRVKRQEQADSLLRRRSISIMALNKSK